MRARLGGLTTSARGHTVTAPARAAFMARFEPIEPGLSPTERRRRAEAAKRLYFSRLALKASLSRASHSRKREPTSEIRSPEVGMTGGTSNAAPSA
jgi:hypothetical protein